MKIMFKLLAVALLMLLPIAHAENALPKGLRIIEEEAFCGAHSIDALTLHEGVLEIRSRAFADSSLKSINLPESISYIAEDAFDGCETVSIDVSPGSPAWEWCTAHGLTGADWTDIVQTDSDSILLSWIAPKGIVCDVIMLADGEWKTVARSLANGTYTVNGLAANTEYTFSLLMSGTETAADGNTTFQFNYALQTAPRTFTLTACDFRWWIRNNECILTGAKLWDSSESVEITIPSELEGYPVTHIGSKAFTCIEGLTKVVLPDTVKHVDSTAFYGCSNLTCVEMQDSVTSIGDYAFANCPKLTDISLSDSITSIGSCAFLNDVSLTAIELPSSLLCLGKKSLYDTGITSLTLPDSLTEIGEQAWNDAMTEIITGERASTFTVSNGILYANGMTELFWVPRTLELTAYNAPQTVTKVASFAFAECSSLLSVSFPGGLETIGNHAFANCGMLTNLSGLERLVSIGSHAFSGCTMLSNNAFLNMTQLQSVGSFAFYDCASLTGIAFPETLTYLGESAFQNCKSLTSVTLGKEMVFIGAAAFYDCTALVSVQMPDSLSDPEGLGSHMFYNCSKLKSISIPIGVTRIGNYTFSGCIRLTSLTLPDGLETIGSAACYQCYQLTGLSVPDSVTSIGAYAFTYCYRLTSLNLPACEVQSYAFSKCTRLASVVFADHPELNTSIQDRAFYGCTLLSSVYLPDNATSIDATAFEGCAKVVLQVIENSFAHTYATANGIDYQLIQP